MLPTFAAEKSMLFNAVQPSKHLSEIPVTPAGSTMLDVGKIYLETKHRPRYFIAEVLDNQKD